MEGHGLSVLFRCSYGGSEETHETPHLGEPVNETKEQRTHKQQRHNGEAIKPTPYTRTWSRHYATSREVATSSPVEVDFFQLT
jgi:hypothetical protein